MAEVILRGCAPEPLGAYLCGLAVLRLVAEQYDPAATGAWSDAGFVLRSSLDREGLRAFLLDDYRPTPMVAPWNKGSGFAPGGASKSAAEALSAIGDSLADRLSPSRHAIAVARDLAPHDDDGFKDKEGIIRRARAALPDDALAWLDAAVVLTTDSLAYPHLLGTGGNLGRLELTANLNANLARIMDLTSGTPTRLSAGWLASLLDGDATQPRVSGAVGQYQPGAAGGVNASTFDGGSAYVNPWEFVLTLEGALLFASAASRRLGATGDNVAAMPFTVRPASTGSGHLSSGETVKGELWLPLWDQHVTLAELSRLIGEGRLRWGGRHASNAIDAARAISTLGTDRGIHAFTRFSVAERHGQSPLAVPAGRVATGHKRSVALTADLDNWLGRVRRQVLPSEPAEALKRVDAALMTLAMGRTEVEAPVLLQGLLGAVADLDQRIGRSDALQVVPPLWWLTPTTWLPALDDHSVEFEIAAGFASLHSRRATTRGPDIDRDHTSYRPSFAEHLRPVSADLPAWTRRPAIVGDIDTLGVVRAAIEVAVNHSRHPAPYPAGPVPITDGRGTPAPKAWNRGADTWFERGRPVRPSSIVAFIDGRLDDERIARLVKALCLVSPRASWPISSGVTEAPGEGERAVVVDPMTALLAPFGQAAVLAVRWRAVPAPVYTRLAGKQTWPRQLTSGRAGWDRVGEEAVSLLRVAGLRAAIAAPPYPEIDAGPTRRDDHTRARRIVAALLLRRPRWAVRDLVRRIADPLPQLLTD